MNFFRTKNVSFRYDAESVLNILATAAVYFLLLKFLAGLEPKRMLSAGLFIYWQRYSECGYLLLVLDIFFSVVYGFAEKLILRYKNFR